MQAIKITFEEATLNVQKGEKVYILHWKFTAKNNKYSVMIKKSSKAVI